MMILNFTSGISGDRYQVTIVSDGNRIFSETYAFGYNCSFDKSAKEKYIGTILRKLLATHNILPTEVVCKGNNVRAGSSISPEEIRKKFYDYIEYIPS